MPTVRSITTFEDHGPPPGRSPWVDGAAPARDVLVVDPDPTWPDRYEQLRARIAAALGPRLLRVDHVGSTSVPGLTAKPIVDVDLVVAAPDDESAYVPALEAVGFTLRVREPWWWEHRMLSAAEPACHLHVYGPDSPVPWRDLVFRDHLARTPSDLDLYAMAKRAAARESAAAGLHAMEYNQLKQDVVRAITRRAFEEAGLLDGARVSARG
jgi:GrpB-like predicted nucleotidyltransferase (UPF0157 family)